MIDGTAIAAAELGCTADVMSLGLISSP